MPTAPIITMAALAFPPVHATPRPPMTHSDRRSREPSR